MGITFHLSIDLRGIAKVGP